MNAPVVFVSHGSPELTLATGHPWAAEAEAWVLAATRAGDLEALTAHRSRWPHSRDAAPTTEHLDPLFVALGAAKGASPSDLFRGFQLGSLSLASLAWDA